MTTTANGAPGARPERLFGNRNYVRLFLAHVASLLGSGVTSVALAVFAYEMTGSNATVVVGTALTLRILAFVLLSPVAGVLADRVDRKRMLIVADLLRMGLLGLFPFITTVWQIYGLIFAINAVTAFFTPTYEASLPEVVGTKLYTRALLVLGARVPSPAAPAGPFPWRPFVPQVTFGTRVLLREPALRRALLLHVAEAAAGAVTIVTTVVYVRDVLGRGDGSFALTMGAVGIGSSIAALLLARRATRVRAEGSTMQRHIEYHRWAERTLLAGGALSALALLPGVLAPGLVMLLLLWALVGAGGAMISIPSVGLLAEHTTPEERGRAYAAHFAWTHLF